MKTAVDLAASSGMLSHGEVIQLKMCVRRLPAKPLIVNLGAGVGTSALAILEARPDARLVTVDKKPLALLKELHALEIAGVDLTNFEQLCGDSVKVGKKWGHGFIDLLFVDSLHTYEHVKNEMEVWDQFVKIGGLVLFHDYADKHPRPKVQRAYRAVKKAADEWAGERKPLFHERILAGFRK